MTRALVRLTLGVVTGITIGLVYGWLVRPVRYVDTSPSSLREDFRTDYVLMVAEAYGGDGDPSLARVRLAALGPDNPVEIIEQASAYARDHGFGPQAVAAIDRLATGLLSIPPTPEIGGP